LSAEEKVFAQFSKNSRTFYPKIANKLSKIWVWDLEKNLFWIPDPGVKKAPDPGSGSATLGALVPLYSPCDFGLNQSLYSH
jgi:hypothetical protein